MASFKFRVEERTVAPELLSWVAIEQSSGVEPELPGDGIPYPILKFCQFHLCGLYGFKRAASAAT